MDAQTDTAKARTVTRDTRPLFSSVYKDDRIPRKSGVQDIEVVFSKEIPLSDADRIGVCNENEFRQVRNGNQESGTHARFRSVLRSMFLGTTATDDDGNVVGEDDPYERARQALRNIERFLNETDASLDDVVRTRMFVVDINEWESIGNAHEEVFRDIRPTTSMVEVNRLIDPDLSVEIEAFAIISD